MPIRVAKVATDFCAAILWRREELSSACGPGLVDGLDIRDPDVEEAAGAVRVRRRLEDDRRFVVGRSTTDVNDHPTVRQRDDRGLALQHGLPAEHLRVEAARPIDVTGNDEMGEHETLVRCWKLGHRGASRDRLVIHSARPQGYLRYRWRAVESVPHELSPSAYE